MKNYDQLLFLLALSHFAHKTVLGLQINSMKISSPTSAKQSSILTAGFSMLALAFAGLPQEAQGSTVLFQDTFDTVNPAWVTDRYAPGGFNSASFDGDNRLAITISQSDSAVNRPPSYSSAFYDTQGKKLSVDSAGEPWRLSADLHLSEELLLSDALFRSDLWAYTGLSYPIIGFYQFDVSDPYNSSAANITNGWRIWDGAGWQDVSAPVTAGWHTLAIEGVQGAFRYYINDVLVYTQTGGTGQSNLQDIFLQGFNFGGPDYTIYWDNVSVQQIPEPSRALLIGLALGSMILRRKRPVKA